MFNHEYLDEEDERVRLIKVVEYLPATMAKELMCKFPDNSAFDFDYTQSSIWSPVAPRPLKYLPTLEMDRVLHFDLEEKDEIGTVNGIISPPSGKPRKKQCGYKIGSVNRSAFKRVMRKIKSNCLSLICLGNVPNNLKKMKRDLDDSMACRSSVKKRSSTPKSSKEWDVVLKAASKHFKKRKRKDQIGHAKLSEYNINNGIF